MILYVTIINQLMKKSVFCQCSSRGCSLYGQLMALVVTVFISCTLSSKEAFADETVTAEYKLKAALIFKLTHFITWPSQPVMTNTSSENVFSICVLGVNPFGKILEPLRQREANGSSIQINYYEQSEDVNQTCQLIFITDSKRAFIKPILSRFKSKGTLTLSDIPGFAAQGGMIELAQGKATLGFIINPEQAKHAGLSIAAPLLNLADIVDSSRSLKSEGK